MMGIFEESNDTCLFLFNLWVNLPATIFFSHVVAVPPFPVISYFITKTCPFDIKRFFLPVKIEKFIGKILIFLIVLLKTLIVGTR